MSDIIALDIGRRRIGVARANTEARLPEPVAVWSNDEHFLQRLKQYIAELEAEVKLLIVGVPFTLSGTPSTQTEYSQSIGAAIAKELDVPMLVIDESLSSQSADSIIALHKQSGQTHNDAVAAAIILARYLDEDKGGTHVS